MLTAPAKRAAASDVARHALIGLILTSVHHAYGAYAYSTPWRLHVVFIAGATALVMLGALAVFRSRPLGWLGTAARWLFALIVLVVPVVLLGVFEGFCNHVLKDLLYFGGLPLGEMARLFPPPRYEMPNDAFFEMTGVLQVVPATLAAAHLYRMVTSRATQTPGAPPSTTSGPRPTSALRSRRWWALVLLGVAQFMIILDVTVVNVALPSIGMDLGLGRAGLTWVVTIYSLAFGGFMLLGGRTADVLGHRRTFVVGVVLFTLASLASGLSLGGIALVVARAVQGLGAALASPAALAIVVTTFEGSERDRALGVWAALGAAGAAAGGLLGGALVSGPGWRWIFFINVPVGVAVASLVRAVVSAGNAGRRDRQLDLGGAVLATVGVGLLIYGLTIAGDRGFGSPWPAVSLLAGTAVLAAFARVEQRHPSPLLRLGVLARRPVAVGALLMLVAAGLLVGNFFVTSMLMQRALDVSAFHTGLAFLPVAIATAIGAHLGARLVGHVGPRATGVAAFGVTAVGLAWLALLPVSPRVPIDVLPGFLVAALGLGAAFVTAMSTALGDVTEAEAGVTGSVVNTSHELGAAIGVAFVSAIAGAALGAGEVTAGYVHAYFASAVAAALVGVVAGRLLPSARPMSHHGRHFAH
jgi:EmrB/QacA subfamily drug resistance transporter